MYLDPHREKSTLDELIPAVLAVVAPHVEALESVDEPYAVVLADRLRRALVRLEPLLDETMVELQAIRQSEVDIAATTANLRDAVLHAATLLRQSKGGRDPMNQAMRKFVGGNSWSWLARRQADKWQTLLESLCTTDADRASRTLGDSMLAYVASLHQHLRAHLILADAQDVLVHALSELSRIGRTCEDAFPEVAERVIPRPIEFDEDQEVSPYDVQ